MKYICLICAEKVMEQMAKADADAHYEEYRKFTDDIRRSGHYVACNRLLPAAEAITVRVRQGNIATADGPFAETKEQFGGYYVIDIQIAARIPGAAHGCVKVRPIAEDEQTLDVLGSR